jgi:nitrite reductase/ring-hydroxylating ferredoxin subunit
MIKVRDPMTWTYVMDEAGLPEGAMAPVYPMGINVVIARVGGALYAVSGTCAHIGCPSSLAPSRAIP